MKIVLIFRKPDPEAYSIEELFRAIALEMNKHVEVIQYVTGGRSKILSDMKNLRKLKADVYHITGDINYITLFLPRKKTVLTLHDIVHFKYTLKGIKRFIYKYLWLIFPIRYAKIVTTISEATAKEILDYLGINKTINVVPNCYNYIFKPVDKTFNTNCPNILQIGTLPHKNVSNLIKAITNIKCNLILIGRLSQDIKDLLEQNQISYENYIGLTLEEIYQSYIKCDIVAFISIHEGFGVPIIEGQAVGRVVITTNYQPMSHVAGNGACLVDPFNIEEIKQRVAQIISDQEYRDKLIKDGFENVSKYSVSSIAKKYLDLYKTL